MGFVTWLVETSDEFLSSAAETQFGAIAATLGTILTVSATLLVILVAINMSVQVRSMDGRTAFMLCTKLVLITIFATNWVQFNSLSSAILSGIDSVAGSLIASIGGPPPGPSGTFAEEFDRIIEALTAYLNAVGESMHWMAGALMETVGFLLISLLGALAAFILVGARMMIAILLGLAPIMIFLTMFEVTKDYFTRWLSATVSFAMFPVFLAGIFATIIGTTKALILKLSNPEDIYTIGAVIPFFMMVLMAKGFILATPFLVKAVSGNIVMPAVTHGVSGSADFARGFANTEGVRARARVGARTTGEVLGAGVRQTPGALRAAPAAVRSTVATSGERIQRIAERAKRLGPREPDPKR